ncbi:MAG: amidophosphoribosyltransferase [Acidobacteriota bacterium]|jgi:amidophosphoribosyltransferase
MCGVFGIFGCPDAAKITVHGLYGLQHRGQESAGVVSWDGSLMHVQKGMGLVSEVFGGRDLSDLPGDVAIGHVRYSTSGDSQLRNAQPIVASTQHGHVALGHNGNLVNGAQLRERLEREGAIFASTTDSEVVLHQFARSSQNDPIDALIDSFRHLHGAFSMVMLCGNALVGVRDPWGFRPLVLGEMDGAAILCSETCALDLLRAHFVREIEPGEVVVIDEKGLQSHKPFPEIKRYPCIFEYVYFARPDTRLFGRVVFPVRIRLGRNLAVEQPADADIVVPIPDSGTPAAIGYSEASGIPLVWGLIRNHYIGRTFIAPRQSIRDLSARIKLNPVPELLEGRRVVLVDDSLVRGTTSRKIVRMVREAGAREVHLRFSSPPIVNPCVYGIDTPDRAELLAANLDLDGIRSFVEADSVGYLSHEGLVSAVSDESESFCRACFGAEYPVKWDKWPAKQRLLFEKEKR